ncbi:MAG: peptidylprolyl isomerase [Bacteroidota bacterium]
MDNQMRILGTLLFAVVIFLTGCKSTKETSPSTESPALLTFKQEKVSKQEFERVYQKNNGGKEEAANHTPAQYQEYLDLYINFKRKVFEAESKGLDTTQAFKSEFASYRKQLAQPYLTAREVEEQLVKEAFERSQYVVKASHLLIQVKEDAAPADTLAAFQKIMAFRDTIMNQGKSFAEMATQYSDDPSAKQNAGNLGYFSAFDMVYPFESGAFSTPVGEVSQPVRTSFGYHLIKVDDKRKSGGTKRAAHIIVRIGDRYSAKDTTQAERRIQEIYGKLANQDFAEVAAQFSDDPNTAPKGGDLGSSRLLPEMEQVKLTLNEGEYSKPFNTRFGWHILKVTEVEASSSFEEARPTLKRKVERDSRSQISRAALIERIKKENEYQLEEANFNAFVATLNANYPRGSWAPEAKDSAVAKLPLFRLGSDYEVSVQDFIDNYLGTRSRSPRMSAEEAARTNLNRFVERKLLQYEEDRLPEKNPEFRYLLKEYRDGILLFTLMEEMVWRKAVEDTTGLEAFYNSNKDQFTANRMVDVEEYSSSDELAIKKVGQLLGLNASRQEIDSLLNQESSLRVTVRMQNYEEGKSDLPASLFDQPIGHVGEIMQTGKFFRIFQVKEKFPAGIKPFEKAKSEVITKYQDYLEKTWLSELETKYPVEVNQEVFQQLFK